MPAFYALAQHDAICDLQFAFLDDVYIVALPERTRALYDALSTALWDCARIRPTKARLASGMPGRSRVLSPTSEVTLTSRSGSETGPSHPNVKVSPCWDLLSATTL